MMRILLERVLFGQHGLSTVGVPVMIGGQHRLVFARLTNLLSDGDGHRMCWNWKGASSLKPCWKHFNVFKKGSDLAHRKPGFVEIDCTDCDRFRSWTAGQLYSTADVVATAAGKVAARTMSKADYDELEKSVGFNHTANGMLMSRLLRRRAIAHRRVFNDNGVGELVPLISFAATPLLSIRSDMVAHRCTYVCIYIYIHTYSYVIVICTVWCLAHYYFFISL